MITDREIRLLYGRNAVISRKGRFVLVHLDRPTPAVVEARTGEFDPDRFFDIDCPVCAMQRDGGIVVFDDYSYESDEDVLLE